MRYCVVGEDERIIAGGCGLADWYMKQGGDENRKRALKLLEESAKDGFEFTRQKLATL